MKKLFVLSSILFILLLGVSCANDSKNSSGSSSVALDGKTYISEDGEIETRFEYGHAYYTFHFRPNATSGETYSIDGDMITFTFLFETIDGITRTFNQMLDEEIKSAKETGKSDQEIEQLKIDFIEWRTQKFHFRKEDDKFILISENENGENEENVYLLKK